ncbi:MAG: hypothetical protein LBU82_04730, partial [Treponema sp.]|nr:hypothetical protein [Treponema sp.]
MAENSFQGEMDPELAALLGTAGSNASPPPDFSDIFGNDDDSSGGPDSGTGPESHGVDLTVVGFPKVTKRLEEKPHNFFNDSNYYKTALSNEGDIAQRVHSILQKYLTTKDPKDRSVFRQQFITPFWQFLQNVAQKVTGAILPPKKFLLRFGIMHPNFLSPDNRTFFGKIVVDNEYNQPIYYVDEWLKAVGTGIISPSTTDEVRVASTDHQSKMMQLLEKANGKLDGAKVLLKAKDQERTHIEGIIRERFDAICERTPFRDFTSVGECYSEPQKRAITEIQDLLKGLLKTNHEMDGTVSDFLQAEADVRSLKDKIESGGGEATADLGAVDAEFGTIRQMAKMTIGRQGNHFPVLTDEYFHCGPNDVGTRENVITILGKIESIDAEVYCRVYKNRLNRIAPYVLLIPTYGDTGFCWEPFDRHNRATSRGRIIIPMYPKNLLLAILTAVADLRWQVAKEKASFYWMEEGLTGNYYQWFQSQKLKGDIKEFFIQDYIMWMTKESEGIQKLEKEVRGTFWRYMPFTKEVKEKLKTRNLVYQELYQRDLNRA